MISSQTSNVSLLIPVYNPTTGWSKIFIERYLATVDALNIHIPIFLINDGSTDDIEKEIEDIKEVLGSSFVYLEYKKNKGKGAALKFGASEVKTEYIIFTDIDFPYDLESMKAVYIASQKKSGLITGYRPDEYYADLSVLRTFMSKSLRWLNRILLGLPVNDTQCGLKAFDSNVKDLLLNCKTDRFLIDLELLLSVSKHKYQITPILVKLRTDIGFTKFNSAVLLKEILNLFILIWKYRILRR